MGGYLPPSTPEEKLFCRRVADAAGRCESSGRLQFTGFLDERQQALALAQLARLSWQGYLFFGGYSDAERTVLALYEGEEPAFEQFPVICLRISCRHADHLTHRDYLGALMGLGFKRECVGDILPDEEGAIVFALPATAKLICNQLSEVGRESVSAAITQLPQSICAASGEPVKISVASLRLDAVLAALLHLSREQTAALIRTERVLVNHIVRSAPSTMLEEGDLLTVRGTGRFRLQSLCGQSKKGRSFVICIKY